MTDKELNSHDLAREIEISKLQEENEELKSQLRGTTHCFDEEEHNRLEEENRELKKQQKEFINYLESWKENEEYCYLASNPIDRCRKDIYKEVLQKYKEIIGVSDEKK